MGKPGKLKISMKAIQGLISSITQTSTTRPFCISSTRTLSSEDLSASFRSIYCTPLHSAAISEHTSSSSISTVISSPPHEEAIDEGTLMSSRFFFSPCNSKLIMGREEKDNQEEEREELVWESKAVALASRDPYGDFRASMEEMVVAHGLWDWSSLKELLDCYLRVNDKKTHKIIMLAFVDLLMDLKSECSSLCSP